MIHHLYTYNYSEAPASGSDVDSFTIVVVAGSDDGKSVVDVEMMSGGNVVVGSSDVGAASVVDTVTFGTEVGKVSVGGKVDNVSFGNKVGNVGNKVLFVDGGRRVVVRRVGVGR